MRSAIVSLILLAFAVGVPTATADQSPPIPPALSDLLPAKPTAAQTPIPVETAPERIEQIAACCKICRAGKACGNSCISRSKTCHQPPGCACDG